MVPFLIVLILAVVGFSISLRANDFNFNTNMKISLMQHYRLMYGDFNVEDISIAGQILFVIASALITLVMMNLLIAIISDTFNRVISENVPLDYLELCKMILE